MQASAVVEKDAQARVCQMFIVADALYGLTLWSTNVFGINLKAALLILMKNKKFLVPTSMFPVLRTSFVTLRTPFLLA